MLSILFIVIAAIFKAISDVLLFRYYTSIFRNLGSFFNPDFSWRNKYKNSDYKQGARFPGSTTIFVFLTDAWHLSNSLMILSIACSVSLYQKIMPTWLNILLVYVVFGLVFELFYSKVLISKRTQQK